MIKQANQNEKGPVVPVDSETQRLADRLNDLGMWSIGQLGGALARALGPRNRKSLGILTYHRVSPHTEGISAPAYNVAPERFREHLTGLKQKGFNFISLRQAIENRNSAEALPEKSVIVTFDDCFESVYTDAWPILEELEVPATLFVSTAYLDSDEPFPFDTWSKQHASQLPAHHYRPMKIAQYQEMAASELIEIGTHTHTHADFREHIDYFRAEMMLAAEIVKEHFGIEDPMFSFPFGSVVQGFAGPELMEAARESGVVCALTTEVALVDPASDPFGWGRINAFCFDTSDTLCGKLSGWYDWAHQLKYWLKARKRERQLS